MGQAKKSDANNVLGASKVGLQTVPSMNQSGESRQSKDGHKPEPIDELSVTK